MVALRPLKPRTRVNTVRSSTLAQMAIIGNTKILRPPMVKEDNRTRMRTTHPSDNKGIQSGLERKKEDIHMQQHPLDEVAMTVQEALKNALKRIKNLTIIPEVLRVRA